MVAQVSWLAVRRPPVPISLSTWLSASPLGLASIVKSAVEGPVFRGCRELSTSFERTGQWLVVIMWSALSKLCLDTALYKNSPLLLLRYYYYYKMAELKAQLLYHVRSWITSWHCPQLWHDVVMINCDICQKSVIIFPHNWALPIDGTHLERVELPFMAKVSLAERRAKISTSWYS
jgi:hypothetical protein